MIKLELYRRKWYNIPRWEKTAFRKCLIAQFVVWPIQHLYPPSQMTREWGLHISIGASQDYITVWYFPITEFSLQSFTFCNMPLKKADQFLIIYFVGNSHGSHKCNDTTRPNRNNHRELQWSLPLKRRDDAEPKRQLQNRA